MDDFMTGFLGLVVLLAITLAGFGAGQASLRDDITYSCDNFGKVEIRGEWYKCGKEA